MKLLFYVFVVAYVAFNHCEKETRRYPKMQVVQSIVEEHKGSLPEFLHCHRIAASFYVGEPALPLVILNYDGKRSKRNPITDACRGLVLNTSNWTVVAKGFNRFVDNGKIKKPTIDRILSKEDGTLIMVFYYNDRWFVNCRYNFGDDLIPSGRCTYRHLFTELFPEFEKHLDRRYTYLFEMCTPENRIVRCYLERKLFLLGALETSTRMEVDSETLDDWAMDWKHSCQRPLDFTHRQPFASELAALLSKGQVDEAKKLVFTLLHQDGKNEETVKEGIVVLYNNGQRQKIKNPLYLALHIFKYRGWPIAHTAIGQEAWRYLNKAYHNASDKRDAALLDLDINAPAIREAFEQPLSDFFHSFPYCSWSTTTGDNNHNDQDGLATEPRQLLDANQEEDTKDDKAKWSVWCPCGEAMQCVRLKRDHVAPRMCHCGKRTGPPNTAGVYTIQVGRLAWLCTDKKCNNTHEAHQQISFVRFQHQPTSRQLKSNIDRTLLNCDSNDGGNVDLVLFCPRISAVQDAFQWFVTVQRSDVMMSRPSHT